MKKFMILKFKNAGLFTYPDKSFVTLDKSKKTSDKEARKRRFEHFYFEEPIAPNHIINMIHVLFGQRPKPSFRKVGLGQEFVEYYENKALESFIRIESLKRKNKNTGTEYFLTETVSLKKDTFDSWNPKTLMYWERFQKFLHDLDSENPNELFENIITTLNKVFKTTSIQSIPLEEVRLMILDLKKTNLTDYNNSIIPLFQLLKERKKMPFENFIRQGDHDIDKNPKTSLMVKSYVNRISRLSGTILVPVDDKDIEDLRKCSGYATLLDGGFVQIHKIVGENVINTSEFRKVSNLSTKTIPYLKPKENES